MKGIILAGGLGTRLHPITKGVSKQLIPIYDKPMIYYPLSVLMLAGLRQILVISTSRDLPFYQNLLGDGRQLGIEFSYASQASPDGLASALLIGKDFLAGDSACLILGDNIFYGHDLASMLAQAKADGADDKATIFAYQVQQPSAYGVVEFASDNRVLSLEEKPAQPKSNYAVTGLYFYPKDVVAKAEQLKPSPRGELEITDLNRLYLQENRLRAKVMQRGFAWLDTGSCDSILRASQFVEVVEKRQGLKIACLEEIALQMGYIDKHKVKEIATSLGESDYKRYLLRLTQGG